MGVYRHSCSPSKVPTSTFLHGHTINTTGLDKISLFSAKEGGSKEGKCYSTRWIPLYENFIQKLFQKTLSSFLPLSCGYLCCKDAGKEYLAFQTLNWEEKEGVNVISSDSINKKKKRSIEIRLKD